MAAAVKQVAAPGDVVMQVPETGILRLGPGLLNHDGKVMATKSGAVKQTKSGHVWVEGRQKRYIPAEGEVVVGTVIDRHGESFMVDIGGPFTATLPQLSFEGATRRNRPNIKAGDVVYARVVSASRDMEPVLSCMDAMGRASGFGALKEGTLLNVTTSLARQLLSSPPAPVLQALGNSLQFELAVGLNGRVWVAASSPRTAILVANAIGASEFLSERQAQTLVSRLVSQVQQ